MKNRRGSDLFRWSVPAVVVGVLTALLVAPLPGAAQTELASQTLGRGYWHLFAAYALGWILLMGWVVSIARRLARVERRLEE